MKKVALIVVLVIVAALLTMPTYAQTKKGEAVIQAGIGLGYPGLYGSSGMPPIFASLDYCIEPKFTVGGIVGYTTSSYGEADYKWTFTYIIIGARGAYHFLENQKNLDAYAGLTLGYNIVSNSFSGPGGAAYHGFYSAGGSYMHFGVFVGGRYYFTPRLAAVAELGYDIGFVKIGLAYKL
jgi:hypothetical protein